MTWSDVLLRDDRVQLSIAGMGGKVRQVLLPDIVSRSLLSLRGDAGANDPVFASREGGSKLTERAVNGMVKRTAAKAGINEVYHRIGCGMPMVRMRLITARRYRRCRQP